MTIDGALVVTMALPYKLLHYYYHCYLIQT